MAPDPSTWQRARRPEQKEARRTSILDAARRLIDGQGLAAAGLNAIAREAGISKANVYRYFESREAVLLELLLEQYHDWADDFAARVTGLDPGVEAATVGDAFAVSFVGRGSLCRLLDAAPTVLERNLSAETLITGKRAAAQRSQDIARLLAERVAGLSFEIAERYLFLVLVNASASWAHCNPAPAMREILGRPEYASMKLEFQPLVAAHAAVLLRGFLGGVE